LHPQPIAEDRPPAPASPYALTKAAAELLVLRIDLARVAPDLRWEEGRPGETYPHVYRAIAIDEVLEVIPWRRGADDPA